MKGRIDKSGWLHIYRPNKDSPVRCPQDSSRVCGDWCALFEDPVKDDDDDKILVSMCTKIMVFDEFVDERMEVKIESNK